MYFNVLPTATKTSNGRKTSENNRTKLCSFLQKWFLINPSYRTMAVPNANNRPEWRVALDIPGEQCYLWFFFGRL